MGEERESQERIENPNPNRPKGEEIETERARRLREKRARKAGTAARKIELSRPAREDPARPVQESEKGN